MQNLQLHLKYAVTIRTAGKLHRPLCFWSAWPLLILLLILFLGGCRRTSAPIVLRSGWVDSSQLLPLHPNYPMIAELRMHYASLEAQRLALLAPSDITVPPDTVSLTIEAASALSPPKPAVEPEQLQAEFLSQLLIAKRRSLERRYERDMEIFQQSLLEAEYQERAQLWTAAEQQAREAILHVEQKYQQRLTATFLTQEAAYAVYQRQMERATKVDDRFTNYRSARKKYELLLRKQQAEKDIVSRTLVTNKQEIERNVRQTTLIILQQQQRQLAKDKERDYQTLENQLFMQLALEGKQYIVPALNFPPQAAAALTFTHTGMPAQVQAGTSFVAGEYNKSIAEIVKAQQQLRKEEKLQQAQMERDIRQLSVALADKHGYRVKFTSEYGSNITVPMQQWLMRYWQVSQ